MTDLTTELRKIVPESDPAWAAVERAADAIDAEVARLTRERDPRGGWHKRYADKSAALAARVSALEVCLRRSDSMIDTAVHEVVGDDDAARKFRHDLRQTMEENHRALSPSEPDLGEPSPPLACPECGWRFGAAEEPGGDS